MKDIYEMFNDIDMDDKEFIELETDELENIKVKKYLKKSINMRKNKKGKYALIASIAFITVLTLGVSLPTYAKQIPLIGNIFSALENSIYKNYKESANEINITKESNGISITINDAVFDGTNITVTYTIESNKDLGENISILNYMNIKGLENSGSTTSHNFKKVSENTYIGQENISLFDLFKDPKDSVNCTINIKGIVNDDNGNEIKGKWTFDISLEATKGQTITMNKSVEKEGITATIDRVTINPMSVFIAYSQSISEDVLNKYDNVIMELAVKDDLGNIYQIEGHGATGDIDMNLSSSITIEKLRDGARKLIITPKVIIKDLDNVKYQKQQTQNGYTGKISTELGETYECIEVKEVILEDIIIDIN